MVKRALRNSQFCIVAMKSIKRAASLIYIFFVLCGLHVVSAQDQSVIHSEYKKAPFFVRKSPVKLANDLAGSDSSDYQKALNIYTWIIHNIKYDVKLYHDAKPEDYSIDHALRKKKGVCGHYAGIFQLLCEAAGVPCLKIDGYSRGASYQEGDVFVEADHTWNAFRADSTWYLVDATWGSGAIISKNQPIKAWWKKRLKKPFVSQKMRFSRRPTLHYFAISPDLLLSDHLPVDWYWQLVQFPVSLSSFESAGWSGYTNEMNHQTLQQISEGTYRKTLDQYAMSSPLQYLQQQATQSVFFNPINTSLIASSAYLQGTAASNTSGDLAEQLSDLEIANKQFRLSVSSMKDHQKTMRETTQQRIKAVDTKLTQELIVPIKQLKSLNHKQNRTCDKQKVKIPALMEVAEKRKAASVINQHKYPRMFPTLRFAPKQNGNAVTTHRQKIAKMNDQLQQTNDTLAKLELKFREDYAGLEVPQQLLKANMQPLVNQLSFMKMLIQNKASESMILEPAHQLKAHLQITDSLQTLIWHIDADLYRTQTLLRQFYHQRLVYYLGIQQLMISVYQLSWGEVCDDALYEHLDSLKVDHFGNVATQEAVWADYLAFQQSFLTDNEPLINSLRDQLPMDLDYAALYLSKRIGGLNFKQYRSHYLGKQLITESENAIVKVDQRMRQIKAEQKEQLRKQQKRA